VEPDGLITEVRAPAGRSHRRTVFVDGEPRLALPVEVLRDLDLRKGDAFDEERVADRLAESAPGCARQRALGLLAYRERGAKELLSRLLEDGYSEDVAQATLDWLLAAGLVDDARFARSTARMLVVTRGYGRDRALRELRSRGVDDGLARDVLDEVASADAEEERACMRARSLARAGDTVPKLAARLARRGFNSSIALRAAQSVLENEGADELGDCEP
jgi:regulatory protein